MRGGECKRTAASLAYCFCLFVCLLLKDRKEERRKERIKRNQEEGGREKKEPLIGRMMKEEGKDTFEHVKVSSP